MKIYIKTLLVFFLSFIFIQVSAADLVTSKGFHYPIKHYKMTKILEENFSKRYKLYLSGDGIIKIKFWDKDMIRVECIKTIEYAHMDISEMGIGDIIIKAKWENKTFKINTEFLQDKLPEGKEITYKQNEYINVYIPKLTNVEVDNNKWGGIECYLDTIGNNKIILKSGKSNITLRVNSKINDIYLRTKNGNIKSFYKIDSTIDKNNARIILDTKSGDINIEKSGN